MKYLILEDFAGKEIPFVFPRRVDHADMREQLPYGKVLSAGYIELIDGKFKVYGGNNELGANSKPEDVEILIEALRART